MKASTKWYIGMACILAAGILSLWIYFANRGVPAIAIGAYQQQALGPAQGAELALKEASGVPGMKLAAENGELGLYLNPETAEFAVLVKESGQIWYSNPANLEEDTIASPFEKENLASQLSITFRDTMGKLDTFNSFTQGVSKNQFRLESLDNGFRVVYTLGDMSIGIDALPRLISKARMDEVVLGKLDEAGAKYVSTRYYPLANNPDVLERLDTAVSRELVLKRMLDYFQQAGYGEEELAFDNEENGIGGGAAGDKPNFTVSLHVQLDEDGLLVSVPAGDIQEAEGYRIRMLNLLPQFGAAGQNETGYMLVPDGTGSLIYLNNGKTRQEVYAQRIYGEDENDNSRRRGQVAQSARLPVFGLKSGDAAWYAAVEKGDAIATVQADISGRNNAYNNLFASFALRGEDELELYKGSTVEEIQMLSERRYEGEISVRYSFLSGDKADYSGMAANYRERLTQQGVLTPLQADGDFPLFVSILGAIDKRKTVLGVPYKGLVPMTTFSEAEGIAERLNGDGITNIQMRYLGWFNEGLNHTAPNKVKVESRLGGSSGLKALSEQLDSTGGKLYPDVAFQHVYREKGRFAPAADAARYITREQAVRTPYNRAFNTMDLDLGTYYLLSPAKLPFYAEQFIKGYNRLGQEGVALRDLGDLLHADYRNKRVVFRETAKFIVQEQLAAFREQYDDVLLTGGNGYALPYASAIVNAPTTDSSFNITDEAVPFYQMVLHGYIDYAGEPANLGGEQDDKIQLLRAIELGSALHFFWSEASSSELKFTPYDVMYATEASAWHDIATAMYKEANEALSGLRSVPMLKHTRHSEDVAQMKYENGVSLYVNYSDQPVTVNGVRIEAKNFAVDGEGQ